MADQSKVSSKTFPLDLQFCSLLCSSLNVWVWIWMLWFFVPLYFRLKKLKKVSLLINTMSKLQKFLRMRRRWELSVFISVVSLMIAFLLVSLSRAASSNFGGSADIWAASFNISHCCKHYCLWKFGSLWMHWRTVTALNSSWFMLNNTGCLDIV